LQQESIGQSDQLHLHAPNIAANSDRSDFLHERISAVGCTIVRAGFKRFTVAARLFRRALPPFRQ